MWPNKNKNIKTTSNISISTTHTQDVCDDVYLEVCEITDFDWRHNLISHQKENKLILSITTQDHIKK